VTQAQLFAAEEMQEPVATHTRWVPHEVSGTWPLQAASPQAQTAGDAGLGAGLPGSASRKAGVEQVLARAGLLAARGAAAWASAAEPAQASRTIRVVRTSRCFDKGHLQSEGEPPRGAAGERPVDRLSRKVLLQWGNRE